MSKLSRFFHEPPDGYGKKKQKIKYKTSAANCLLQ